MFKRFWNWMMRTLKRIEMFIWPRASDRVILFDLDGTLCDFDGELRKYMDSISSPGEVIPEDLWDESRDWLYQRRRLITSQPGWWRGLPRFNLGFDVLNYVLNRDEFDEVDIHVLTKGPQSKPFAWKEKVEWCKKNLPDRVKITVSEDKGLVYERVLVDDWPGYITRWLENRPRGLVIMPAHDHNKTFVHPQVIRYDGSDEAKEKVFAAVRKRLLE